ncbi:YlmH/Sll1252 family protein [Bacillus carboniphilus]|uniref:YlmH/Sll1252 family protein n=1 Tax=Bacillus carboniphilus TaxID=86663 RepID=A0ABY9K195_9BACI|nr:YlmH/Sll1252 family protein [Bacillus carboniphilus]WLR43610.1 YlmH/Sll1252 family protein [Bacillus carboniphilus]
MKSIYQHFRYSERPFIDRALGWKKLAEERHQIKLTDFLNPREQKIVQALIGKNDDCEVRFYGGYNEAERKRAIIFPSYLEPSKDDFSIALFEVDYPNKFVELEHRHLLGALLSLGLKREKFGDILKTESKLQFITGLELDAYLPMNLNEVGKYKVKLKKVFTDELNIPKTEWDEKGVTVSSLRLDVVLSSIYNLSRQKAQAYIKAGKVKVNWTETEEVNIEVEENDMLSIRGLGRSKITELNGKTKNGKVKMVVGLLK